MDHIAWSISLTIIITVPSHLSSDQNKQFNTLKGIDDIFGALVMFHLFDSVGFWLISLDSFYARRIFLCTLLLSFLKSNHPG